MSKAWFEGMALLPLACLALACSAPRIPSLEGEWVGGFRLGPDWTFARAHFTAAKGEAAGSTLDLPFDYAAGLKVTPPVVSDGEVRFEVAAGESSRFLFKGRWEEGSAANGTVRPLRITGQVTRGEAQGPFELHRLQALDPKVLAEYTGAYQIGADRFAYVQPWDELGGDHPMWFDESGEIRALYPVAPDQFVMGPAASLPAPAEARVTFTRAPDGTIAGLVRQPLRPAGDAPATPSKADAQAGPPVADAGRLEARHVRLWNETDLVFKNGDVTLAGTLTAPQGEGRHPAIVLLHGSGPQDRRGLLPFTSFLVRHGIALFGYDKRGVGGSSGDWHGASFDDLASDAIAAVELLRARPDIDPDRIGVFGVSQGGWIGPLAASRSRHVAFVISVSGPGTTPGEQQLDHLGNELRAEGVGEPGIAQALALARLTQDYARSGRGWDRVEAAVAQAQGQEWFFPDMVPPQGHWSYGLWHLVFDYDPRPALKGVRCPILAIFGGRDLMVPEEKNRAIWEAALKAGGNRDRMLRTFPAGNHMLWEAGVGTMREIPRLRRFVPGYAEAIREWVLARVR